MNSCLFLYKLSVSNKYEPALVSLFDFGSCWLVLENRIPHCVHPHHIILWILWVTLLRNKDNLLLIPYSCFLVFSYFLEAWIVLMPHDRYWLGKQVVSRITKPPTYCLKNYDPQKSVLSYAHSNLRRVDISLFTITRNPGKCLLVLRVTRNLDISFYVSTCLSTCQNKLRSTSDCAHEYLCFTT